MEKSNFKLTLEPIFRQTSLLLTGLEGIIEINVNGINIFANRENQYTDKIFYPLRWLIQNFQGFLKEGMPKNITPAIRLFEELNQVSEEYYQRLYIEGRSSYAFPKPGKECFGKWVGEHTFNYGYTEQPVIFQRRSDMMEVSWKINPAYFYNPEGSEGVPLDSFKQGIVSTIVDTLKKIKESNRIIDYPIWQDQLDFSYLKI